MVRALGWDSAHLDSIPGSIRDPLSKSLITSWVLRCPMEMRFPGGLDWKLFRAGTTSHYVHTTPGRMGP